MTTHPETRGVTAEHCALAEKVLRALGFATIEAEDIGVVSEAIAAAERRGAEPFAQGMSAKPGDVLAGYWLDRKAVSNGVFGWWVNGEGGFISLPNLIAAIRARSKP